MDVTTGTVVDGKVVVDGDVLPEGRTVGVFLVGDPEPYELSPSEADALGEAIREVRTGQHLDGDRHLAGLRTHR
jgi:hypothetical protein